MAREGLLARTLVELADTLVDDFDVVELLTLLSDRCVEMFDVAAAGLMLAAPEGDLRVVASSSQEMRLVELFEIQAHEGPCSDCYRTGAPSLNPSLETENGRWPRFGPAALEAGFRSVHALPILIERAKGLLAERVGLDTNDAFSWLRNHARSHNLLLVDVAQSVIDGSVAPAPPSKKRRS